MKTVFNQPCLHKHPQKTVRFVPSTITFVFHTNKFRPYSSACKVMWEHLSVFHKLGLLAGVRTEVLTQPALKRNGVVSCFLRLLDSFLSSSSSYQNHTFHCQTQAFSIRRLGATRAQCTLETSQALVCIGFSTCFFRYKALVKLQV